MHIVWLILALLFAISLLIISHELGHFLVAKCAKIKVIRFSVGFGKILFRKKLLGGTEFVVSLIPLGGYVKMLDEREGPVAQHELSQAFNQQSVLKRVAVVAAGPCLNFLLALFIFTLVYRLGITQLKPVIANTIPHSIAAQANIPVTTEIKKINGQVVSNWNDVVFKLLNVYGNNAMLAIESDDKNYQLNLAGWRLDPLKPDFIRSLGIIPKIPTSDELKTDPYQYLELQQYPLVQASRTACVQTLAYIHFNFLITYKLINGTISLKSLSGPLTLFQGVNQAINQGWITYLYMLAVLSIAIGFVNLIPIPGLDGGHLLFLLIEAVRGKAVSVGVQVLAYRLGIIIIAILMVQSFTNDLLRI